MRLREIIYQVAEELQCEVIGIEVMSDHVHLLCEVDPQFGIHRFVKRVKGRSSRLLRFVATVGGAPLSLIKQYIENQKDV